jgi:hypothetical protein
MATPLVQTRKSVAPPMVESKNERRLTLGEVKMGFSGDRDTNRVQARRLSTIKSTPTLNTIENKVIQKPTLKTLPKPVSENTSQNVKPTTPFSKPTNINRLTPSIKQDRIQSSPNGMISDFSKIIKSPTSGYSNISRDISTRNINPAVSRRIDFKMEDSEISSSTPSYYKSFKWYEPSDFVKTILKQHAL